MLGYRVRHAFAYRGRWYTRANEAEVLRRLPKALRNRYVQEGILDEIRTPAPAAAPSPTE